MLNELVGFDLKVATEKVAELSAAIKDGSVVLDQKKSDQLWQIRRKLSEAVNDLVLFI